MIFIVGKTLPGQQNDRLNKTAVTTKYKMNSYRKGDYVEYMTLQPEVHVEEMFGYGQVPPEEINEERHIGRIKSVIGDGEAYLIISLQPLEGFYCVENRDKIIRHLPDNEVTEEMINYQDSSQYMAPNVYLNEDPVNGSIPEECMVIARKAMASLFPEEEIVNMNFRKSFFRKEDIICNLENLMSSYVKTSSESYDKLQDMKNEFIKEIKQKRFKEYYQVDVVIKLTEDDDPMLTAWLEEQGYHSIPGEFGTRTYLVAIDTNYKEVSIMRDIVERTRFFRSLGPEFDQVKNMEGRFREAVFER